ncbi:hypothetical protein M0802_006384 [Mischocyttarus mexicanus]|nr:hypothetical protein M0802_006384 [Mischocyttarus mexicanus]
MDASARQLTVTRSPSCMIMIQAQPCAAVDILLQPSSFVQNPVLVGRQDGDHSYERLENWIEGNQMGNTMQREAKQGFSWIGRISCRPCPLSDHSWKQPAWIENTLIRCNWETFVTVYPPRCASISSVSESWVSLFASKHVILLLRKCDVWEKHKSQTLSHQRIVNIETVDHLKMAEPYWSSDSPDAGDGGDGGDGGDHCGSAFSLSFFLARSSFLAVQERKKKNTPCTYTESSYYSPPRLFL